jgi:AcrR family transcriptional regulator
MPYPDEPFTRNNHDDVYTRVIKSAWHRLFATSVGDLSLGEIAREIGVTPAAVHHYFRGPRAVAEKIAIQALKTLHEAMTARDEWNRPRCKPLGELVTAFVEFAVKRPRHFDLAFSADYANKEVFPKVEEWRIAVLDAQYRVLRSELGREPLVEETLLFAGLLRGGAELAIEQGLAAPIILTSLERFIAGAKERAYAPVAPS